MAVLDFLRQLRGVNTPYLGAYTTAEIATINAAIASGGYAPALGSHCVNSETGTVMYLRGIGVAASLVDGGGNSAYQQPLIYATAALQREKAGTGPMRIGFIGDSIKAGAFGGGTVSNVNNRQFCFADQMAVLLTAAGYKATSQATFGDQNFNIGATTNIYDPSISMGAGWSYQGGGNTQWSLGGNWALNNSNTNRYSRSGLTKAFNQVDVIVITNAAYGVLNVAVNGGASIQSIDCSTPGSGALLKTTINIPGGLTTGSIDVFKAAADGKAVVVIGIIPRDTTAPEIECYNIATGSATAATWANAALGYSPLNGIGLLNLDLAFVDLTVNPANTAVASAGYEADLQTIHDKVALTGDVIFVSNYAIGTANGLANQPRITQSMAKIAALNNRRFVDPYSAVGQFAQLQAAGNFPPAEVIHAKLPLLADSVKRQYGAVGF